MDFFPWQVNEVLSAIELNAFAEPIKRGEGFLDPDPEEAEGIPKGLPFH